MSEPGARLVCSSCNQSKQFLKRVSSKIVAGWELNMCATCLDGKLEPRHVIIIALNSNMDMDRTKIHEYVTKRRYLGAEILFKETIK